MWNTGDEDWRGVELSLVANELQLLQTAEQQAAAKALTARNAPSSRFFDVFVSVCVSYNQND